MSVIRRSASLLPAASAVLALASFVFPGPGTQASSAAGLAARGPGVSTLEAPHADTVGTRDRIDRGALLGGLRTLAHDSMEGREAGTPGGLRARAYVEARVAALGLAPLDGGWRHTFRYTPRGGNQPMEGVNIVGLIPGTVHPDRYIVVTAHYDHLGMRGDEIFNGADDNASGTSALLAMAQWLQSNRPRHTVLLAALDAEEKGLQGARGFVANPPVPLERVVMNMNLDMVSRNEAGELYAAGTHHYPFLVPLVEEAAAASRISLLMGHDRPDLPPGDDWTLASDHGPFHQAGIPFLYFGVEDHPGYHNPTDVFEEITPEFYLEAVETILDMVLLVDRHGESILDARN